MFGLKRDPLDKELNETLLKHMYVDFKFVEKLSGEHFRIEEKLLFYDENLDVAVLQVKKGNQALPPSLGSFIRLDPDRDIGEKIYLIGHHKIEQKSINYGIGLWKPTEKKMQELERFCEEIGEENGYVGLDSKERVVIKCEFSQGASGSPGIVLCNNGVNVALLYLEGYPKFYYARHFQENFKGHFPQNNVLQQGVSILSVRDAMNKNESYHKLMYELFPLEDNLMCDEIKTFPEPPNTSDSRIRKGILEVLQLNAAFMLEIFGSVVVSMIIYYIYNNL